MAAKSIFPSTRKMARIFKPLKKGDSIRCAYLYQDGGIVVVFERWIREAETYFGYAKAGRLPNGVSCQFKGRIVCHEWGGVPQLRAALECGLHCISAKVPSLHEGSDNTRKLGIPIGHVSFDTPVGTLGALTQELIADGFSYDEHQQTYGVTWEELCANRRWGDKKVVERFDMRAMLSEQLTQVEV